MADISVHIDEDDDNPVRIDPVTGTIETDQPDGGVVVHFNPSRSSAGADEDDFYRNLADDIDDLNSIANELCDAIEADIQSRRNYVEIRKRGMDFLGLEIKEPRATAADTSAAVEGMSTVTNPLLLEACLKSWANAVGEFLPAEGPVKVVAEGEDSEDDDQLAEALERDLNYWFTTTATEYVPDTSHMLLWGPIFGGSGFKKAYRCPMRRRPVAESIDPEDLIVSNTKKDLRSCERITHQSEVRPSVMRRMELLGVWRKSDMAPPSPGMPDAVDSKIAAIQGTSPTPQRPDDQPYIIWETQCELDLPKFAPGKFKAEGIPLPYLVTIEKDSREIKCIRRDWREDDEECERKRLYIKYPWIPGPGFYGTGMLHILGNSSNAMTAAWREALDAGMFANFPSGLIAKLAGRQNTSDIKLAPGTLQPVETSGQDIRAVVAPLPYKDITSGLLQLMQMIVTQSQQVGGIPDLPVGEGMQNVPVGTMLTQVEQATKVISAAHKGLHAAFAEEIGLIIDLFRENPEDLWKNNKNCPPDYWTNEKFELALKNCNLKPASDPNVPSHVHRVAKAIALIQLTTNPVLGVWLNPEEVLRRALRAVREDAKGLLLAEDEVAAKQQAMQQQQAPQGAGADPAVGQARMISAQSQAQKAQADIAIDQQKLQLDQQKLVMQKTIEDTQLAKELVIHRSDQEHEQAIEARKSAIEGQRMQHEAGIAVAEHQQSALQNAHERQMAESEHAMTMREHAAKTEQDTIQNAHDRDMQEREHDLAVHQAMNPPKPAGKK